MTHLRKIVYDPVRKLYQPALSEEHVIAQITGFLSLRGAKVRRIHERIPGKTQRGFKYRMSISGIPDLSGWFPPSRLRDGGGSPILVPVQFWIECKRPGGKRRPAQEDFIREAQEDGVIAFFAESVEDVISEFEKRGIRL